MGRVREYIKVKARPCWTLFDSGAENTYVAAAAAAPLRPEKLRRARKTRLGGNLHTITRDCRLVALVDGKPVEVRAYVIDRIGRDRRARRDFDVLFGARAMQDWGIELNLKRERLDLSGYPGEFVEF